MKKEIPRGLLHSESFFFSNITKLTVAIGPINNHSRDQLRPLRFLP